MSICQADYHEDQYTLKCGTYWRPSVAARGFDRVRQIRRVRFLRHDQNHGRPRRAAPTVRSELICTIEFEGDEHQFSGALDLQDHGNVCARVIQRGSELFTSLH